MFCLFVAAGLPLRVQLRRDPEVDQRLRRLQRLLLVDSVKGENRERSRRRKRKKKKERKREREGFASKANLLRALLPIKRGRIKPGVKKEAKERLCRNEAKRPEEISHTERSYITRRQTDKVSP